MNLRALNTCFFLSHLRVFSVHYLAKLPPLCNAYPGSHGRHASRFPATTTVRAFVLIARNVQNFLEVPFPRARSSRRTGRGAHTTYQYNTQYAGKTALPAVTFNADACVAGFNLDPNEHTRHNA